MWGRHGGREGERGNSKREREGGERGRERREGKRERGKEGGGSYLAQAGFKLAMADNDDLSISQVLELQVCIITPPLCGTRDETQGLCMLEKHSIYRSIDHSP